MHPAGEEVVYLLSGAIDLVLDGADGERIVPLRDGEAYIVPRGTWHRAVVPRSRRGAVHHTRRGYAPSPGVVAATADGTRPLVALTTS